MYIIIACVVLLLLFFPFKIKLSLIYQDNKIHVYIFSKQFHVKEKIAEDVTNACNAKKFSDALDKLLPKSFRRTINILRRNRLKPGVHFNCELNYGFEDAALTGISYGVFSSLSAAVYELISEFCNVRKYNFVINPQFNNPMLNFRISSIISINLVKIIYIVIILFK